MYLSPKPVTLKNGTYLLHTPTGNDAAAIIRFEKQIARQSPYLVRYEEEVSTSLQKKRQQIVSYLVNPSGLLLLAGRDGVVAGMVTVTPLSTYKKVKHRATISLAVDKDYWSLGIGSTLFQTAIGYAKETELSQIELEVAVTNKTALNLYLKNGFITYGERSHAYQLDDGSYLDEYLMYKQL